MTEFRQFAALPYLELDGSIAVCLVTSRDTGRWVIPKGWPKQGLTPQDLAAREARQEAGLAGIVSSIPIGSYTYRKRLRFFLRVTCHVAVYPMLCEKQKLIWREKSERRQAWAGCEEAARRVDEPELARLIASLPEWLRHTRQQSDTP